MMLAWRSILLLLPTMLEDPIEDLAHIACTRSTSYARIGKMYSFFDKLLSMLSDDIGRKLQVSIGKWPLAEAIIFQAQNGSFQNLQFRISHVI